MDPMLRGSGRTESRGNAQQSVEITFCDRVERITGNMFLKKTIGCDYHNHPWRGQ
jgi:hypothetical protein